eukprot:TRINITY_DN1238_c0_g1_i1.p1 TRINITY_DN1238_c0_g1~~TRINITY_DN1238_c0_g1_i1.p1  ORF type:complete len:501 (+),score=93.01 TRINITY_DN1238_c0_g1_i1:25-1503(+)
MSDSRSQLPSKVLTATTVPQAVQDAKYAVRGALVQKAAAYKAALAAGENSLPFDRVTYCNIGNPQAVGQEALTFPRQVLALVNYPQLLEQEAAKSLFPADVIARAQEILSNIGASGAYSHSAGHQYFRESIASFINLRDGRACDDSAYASPDRIFMSDGASPSVQRVLQLLIRSPADGIMIPIPQYPLYTASIALCGGTPVKYYLDEAQGWGLDAAALETAYASAPAEVTPRALCVINPGNPTGGVLSLETMQQIIRFCVKHHVVLLADEVYQENVYAEGKQFVSFKKVLTDMGAEFASLELFSFHSVSKGFLGECGKRSGYVELTNVDAGAAGQLYKLASVNLCPNVDGQVIMSLMVNPPVAGDASFELYAKERDAILDGLKAKANTLVATLNSLDGISCQPAQGAMYAFPSISLSDKIVAAAAEKELSADAFYCFELLDATGLCVVPGSGFGQRDGTFHFRTTFLPKAGDLVSVMKAFATFHTAFLKRFE